MEPPEPVDKKILFGLNDLRSFFRNMGVKGQN